LATNSKYKPNKPLNAELTGKVYIILDNKIDFPLWFNLFTLQYCWW